MSPSPLSPATSPRTRIDADAGARQAFVLLRTVFTVAPIAFGLDKFTNLLCQWDKYLSPTARRALPVSPETFMRLVGVVEMAVGAAMFVPRWRRAAAWIAGGWLASIAANLTLNRDYDIAARDVWLALGALALAQAQPSAHAPQRRSEPALLEEEHELTFGRESAEVPEPVVHS